MGFVRPAVGLADHRNGAVSVSGQANQVHKRAVTRRGEGFVNVGHRALLVLDGAMIPPRRGCGGHPGANPVALILGGATV